MTPHPDRPGVVNNVSAHGTNHARMSTNRDICRSTSISLSLSLLFANPARWFDCFCCLHSIRFPASNCKLGIPKLLERTVLFPLLRILDKGRLKRPLLIAIAATPSLFLSPTW